MTLWATPPVTVRMRYPRPDTGFRRDQIDSVNQRIQRGSDNGIGRSSHAGGLSLRPHEGEGVLGASADAGVHDRSRKDFRSSQA